MPDIKSDITLIIPWLSANCAKAGWFVAGECENGHRFAKEIICGKEWCPRCGEVDSVAHNRKFARWLSKLQQMESVGYFVFTLPESVRAKYRAKTELARLGHQVQELLRSYGFSRGLRRWHWFGEGGKNEGGILPHRGAAMVLQPDTKKYRYFDINGKGLPPDPKYHPHLNCLVDGGYLSAEELAGIKAAYARILGVDMADVNYRYRQSPGRMVHTLKYVARATFRDYRWDPGLAVELRGFRNMVAWGRGRWAGGPAWSLADLQGADRAMTADLDIRAVESLVQGVCPVCGKPVAWGKPRPIGLLLMAEKTLLGAGYYRLADGRAPPPGDWYHQLHPRLGYLLNLKRYELEVAAERAMARSEAEADYQAALWRETVS